MKRFTTARRVSKREVLHEASIASRKLTYALRLFRNSRRLFFVIACVLYVLSVANLVVAYQSSRDTLDMPGASQPHKVGSLITQGDVSMKFEQLRRTSDTGPGVPPLTEGYEMMVVSFWVYNRTDRPMHVLPSSDTYVKDQDGNIHYLTPMTLQHPFRAGELLPAEEIKGELSYAVPKAASLKLYVDAIWSGGTIPVSL